MNDRPLRIAVVGGGVAGITAAHILQRRHEITLYERNDYVGGHTHTIVVPEGPDAGTPVDTGFIVCNDRTYPLFLRLLEQLEVGLRKTEMSFGFHCERTGLHYAGTGLNGLFAQRRNLLRPGFWRLIREIGRFCRDAQDHLEIDAVPTTTLGEYLCDRGYPALLTDEYIRPMASAIWSTAPDEVLAFPAEAFLRFFDNHGLLSLTDRPQWYTIFGGSQRYVKAFLRSFRGVVRTGAQVLSLSREEKGVRLRTSDRGDERFDAAVLATHADEALGLLENPTAEEGRLLGAWRYQSNRTVLHSDPAVLPSPRRGWACWNYVREGGHEEGPVSVTYYMNRLQGLETQHDYFVTLNRRSSHPPETVIAEVTYTHPTYTFESMATQADLPSLNGRRRTFFCGSYFGYGFHEDAVRAGVAVGQAFGLDL